MATDMATPTSRIRTSEWTFWTLSARWLLRRARIRERRRSSSQRPQSGTYQVDFDPLVDNAGHLALRAFDITDPVTGQIAVGGGEGRVAATAPGQRLRLQFTAIEGQRLRARANQLIGANVQQVTGPGGEVVSESWGGALPVFIVPETGTYEIVSTLGLDLSYLRASVEEVPTPALTELVLDGPARVASIVGNGGEIGFHGASVAGQRIKFTVSAGSDVSGFAELVDASGMVIDFVDIPDDGVGTMLSDPGGGDYTVIVTGSPGQVSVRARSHDAPNSVVVTPDGGAVQVGSEGGYANVDADLDSSSDYRIRVTPREGTRGSSLNAYSPMYWWNYIEFLPTSRDDVWTFTPPDTATYAISIYAFDWKLFPTADVEIYTAVSTPQIDVDHGSPDDVGGMNMHADWVTDSAQPIAGYAVVVDGQPTTDPGTTPTQQSAETDLQLTPGQHWLHVRAIDVDGNSGAVAHRRIRVAPELAGVALEAASVTPGSPGYATSDTPTLSVDVPTGLVDAQARFIVRKDGRWVDSFDVPIVDDRAQWTAPGRLLQAGESYTVTAQLLDSDDRLGPPGAPSAFTVDALAAEVSPNPCVGADCHSATQSLFAGTLAAGAEPSSTSPASPTKRTTTGSLTPT